MTDSNFAYIVHNNILSFGVHNLNYLWVYEKSETESDMLSVLITKSKLKQSKMKEIKK